MNKTTNTTQPYLILMLGIIAVSTASVLIRLAQNDAPSIVIAASRMSLSALLLAPVVLRNYRAEMKALQRRQILLMALAGLFLAIHFTSWITSLEMTSVTSSVVLVSTSPLWVALASPFVLKEKVPWQMYIGLAIAFIGGIMVSASEPSTVSQASQQNILAGNGLALLGALTSAGYMLAGRQIRNKISLIPYVFIVYGISSVFLLLMCLFSGASFQGYQATTYLLFLALAVIPQLIGHSSFNWSLKYLPAAFVSVSLLGEPVGSAILAMIILNEIPTPPELIGAILILTGIFYVSKVMNREQKTNTIDKGGKNAAEMQ